MTTRSTFAILAAALASTAGAQQHMPPSGGAAPFDARKPLPLTAVMAEHQKRNMREHLAVVQEIVAALAADDLAAAGSAARKIGYSESMAQMCRHMGGGAPGFTEMALLFHRTADAITAAAGRGDKPGATRALGETLGTCVGCHAAWRQQVVTPGEWQRLSSGVEQRPTQ